MLEQTDNTLEVAIEQNTVLHTVLLKLICYVIALWLERANFRWCRHLAISSVRLFREVDLAAERMWKASARHRLHRLLVLL